MNILQQPEEEDEEEEEEEEEEKEEVHQEPRLTYMSYWDNRRVLEAHHHFRRLNELFKSLLVEYRGDTDADEWREYMRYIIRETGETPFHFSVMSWLLYLSSRLNKKHSSILPSRKKTMQKNPHIFRQEERHWVDQLEKNVELIKLLNGYPKSKGENVFVYRGQRDNSMFTSLTPGQIYVTPAFFSTTLNVSTAINFAGGFDTTDRIIKIDIPSGFQLPVISENITELNNYQRGGSEAEVLYPPNTKFQFMGITQQVLVVYTDRNGEFQEKRIDIINLRLSKLAPIPNKKTFIKKLLPLVKKIAEKYYLPETPSSSQISNMTDSQPESQPESPPQSPPPSPSHDYGGGSRKKTKKSKRKTRRKTRKYKKKLIYKQNK